MGINVNTVYRNITARPTLNSNVNAGPLFQYEKHKNGLEKPNCVSNVFGRRRMKINLELTTQIGRADTVTGKTGDSEKTKTNFRGKCNELYAGRETVTNVLNVAKGQYEIRIVTT